MCSLMKLMAISNWMLKETPCTKRTDEQWDKLGRTVVLSPSLLVGVQCQGVQSPEQPV